MRVCIKCKQSFNLVYITHEPWIYDNILCEKCYKRFTGNYPKFKPYYSQCDFSGQNSLITNNGIDSCINDLINYVSSEDNTEEEKLDKLKKLNEIINDSCSMGDYDRAKYIVEFLLTNPNIPISDDDRMELQEINEYIIWKKDEEAKRKRNEAYKDKEKLTPEDKEKRDEYRRLFNER